MAAIALFVSLGGTAWALTLPAGSVGTKQLKNGAVTTKKLKNGAVTSAKIANSAVTSAKIANSAVTSAKIANNAVGSSQLNVSSLTGLVKGNGLLQSMTAAAPATNAFISSPPVLASVPGFGEVRLILCGTKAAGYHSYIQLLSFGSAASFLAIGQGFGHPEPAGSPVAATVDGSAGDLGGGGGTLISAVVSNTAPGMDATLDIQFSRGTGSSVTGAHVSVAMLDDGANCRASAQTIIQQ